ncbi:hypothetical protein VNO80_30542 [Phaseolus coccineus]|uniref:Uncharacterized protein n=1 Tax=Phaseolus coccineus TaxID=3886 RepID=A0AAN9LD55_PHACN
MDSASTERSMNISMMLNGNPCCWLVLMQGQFSYGVVGSGFSCDLAVRVKADQGECGMLAFLWQEGCVSTTTRGGFARPVKLFSRRGASSCQDGGITNVRELVTLCSVSICMLGWEKLFYAAGTRVTDEIAHKWEAPVLA